MQLNGVITLHKAKCKVQTRSKIELLLWHFMQRRFQNNAKELNEWRIMVLKQILHLYQFNQKSVYKPCLKSRTESPVFWQVIQFSHNQSRVFWQVIQFSHYQSTFFWLKGTVSVCLYDLRSSYPQFSITIYQVKCQDSLLKQQ